MQRVQQRQHRISNGPVTGTRRMEPSAEPRRVGTEGARGPPISVRHESASSRHCRRLLAPQPLARRATSPELRKASLAWSGGENHSASRRRSPTDGGDARTEVVAARSIEYARVDLGTYMVGLPSCACTCRRLG